MSVPRPSDPQSPPSTSRVILDVLLLGPRIAFRFVVVGLTLLVPLSPWFMIIWFFSHVVVLKDPTFSWMMLACTVGMVLTVFVPALMAPPRPGERPSLTWRLGGWWARYLPPPLGLARLIRQRKDRSEDSGR